MRRALHHFFVCGVPIRTGTGYLLNGRFHEAEYFECDCDGPKEWPKSDWPYVVQPDGSAKATFSKGADIRYTKDSANREGE